jgi:hypothetical protein
MVEWRAEGVTTLSDGMFFSRRERIVALTQEKKLPGVHPESAFVEAGALLSYGPSLPDLFQRALTLEGFSRARNRLICRWSSRASWSFLSISRPHGFWG